MTFSGDYTYIKFSKMKKLKVRENIEIIIIYCICQCTKTGMYKGMEANTCILHK